MASAYLDEYNRRRKFSWRNWKNREVLANAAASVAALGAKVFGPHRASLSNMARMPMTVFGFGSVDYAAFHYCSGIGWLVMGVSAVVLELIIADEAE